MRAASSSVDPRIVVGASLAAATLYLLFLCPEAYWGDSASLSSRDQPMTYCEGKTRRRPR